MKSPKQNQNLLALLLLQRTRTLRGGKQAISDIRASRCFLPSHQSFQCPISSDWAPMNYRGSCQSYFSIGSEEPLQTENESLSVFIDTRAAFSMLNSTVIKWPLPQSTTAVQIVEISNKLQQPPVSEPIPFYVVPWELQTLFSLVPLPYLFIGLSIL